MAVIGLIVDRGGIGGTSHDDAFPRVRMMLLAEQDCRVIPFLGKEGGG